jgi:hypothetical protein
MCAPKQWGQDDPSCEVPINSVIIYIQPDAGARFFRLFLVAQQEIGIDRISIKTTLPRKREKDFELKFVRTKSSIKSRPLQGSSVQQKLNPRTKQTRKFSG